MKQSPGFAGAFSCGRNRPLKALQTIFDKLTGILVIPILCDKIPKNRVTLQRHNPRSKSLIFINNGGPGGTRTPNQAVMSRRL